VGKNCIDAGKYYRIDPKLELLRQAVEGTIHVNGTALASPKASNLPLPRAVRDRLTARETEVLRLIANGKSTKEVAHLLGMSFKTAACHRYRIMDKLAIHDTASLTRYAIREKLIEP
jgi:DNA-binding NarL/FixJ family response regulator